MFWGLWTQPDSPLSQVSSSPGGRGSSVGRARDSWWGGTGFDARCGRPLPTGWSGVIIMWPARQKSWSKLPALSRVWHYVKLSDVSLGIRPRYTRYTLVAVEDVKKPNELTKSCSVKSFPAFTWCSSLSGNHCTLFIWVLGCFRNYPWWEAMNDWKNISFHFRTVKVKIFIYFFLRISSDSSSFFTLFHQSKWSCDFFQTLPFTPELRFPTINLNDRKWPQAILVWKEPL